MKHYKFSALLLKNGWMEPAYVGVDDKGIITYLSSEKPICEDIEIVHGAAVPGFQNSHSHAFQYGMAGMAERHTSGTKDDFWSWREAMYQCALAQDPDQLQVLATTLYQEMLRHGYTQVAEFHYLHHDKNGNPYDNKAEIGERLVAAAATSGIKITLVPVFYQKGSFGEAPQERQKRFISSTMEDYFELLESSKKAVGHYHNASLGFGVHSLRAVDAADIIRTFEQGPKDLPFHLHAAEQLKEIADCTAYLGQRPVEWLLDHLPLDHRFNLVHCTHMSSEETKKLALSGANAVLCTGTEGNLGDGIFNLKDYASYGGKWCLGTDSHISLNPLEDLRWLDYTQRMLTHQRNTFDNGASTLVKNTILNGRLAMGNSGNKDYFEIGRALDAAVYDLKRPLLKQAAISDLLPVIIYTADSSALLGTMVDGSWIR
ncbi:formimidoylglutamate deiminase [Pedobacter sp. MC2016-14]|uniref:formimidoylglutamate deiminase n=1 Tax=Pedobacter sp. MC2016-14 TaxID=2897327 RepID=UPI001E2D1EF9|nr:formimidoylglutamate deiminase [Pedobacter sp. MC2016-14]MCD0490418.1 formimidoylglutamate deiminase [Pedobacter sp. MC2016-14]